MESGLPQQLAAYEHRVSHLLSDGLDLSGRFEAHRDHARELVALRAWQRECAATISQLSGGSKAHWLSRAYSEAFLLKNAGSAGEAAAQTIVERIIAVLRQAQASLAEMRQGTPQGAVNRPASGRFAFVQDPSLRPRLEQAFVDGQAALDRGAPTLALVTWASILEAIITHALEHHLDQEGQSVEGARSVADWTFEARIAAAERARLISSGCARLPDVARQYRTLLDDSGLLGPDAETSERDAKVTGQVLRLIMRDLAPGR
jgi:hypothetical protein